MKDFFKKMPFFLLFSQVFFRETLDGWKILCYNKLKFIAVTWYMVRGKRFRKMLKKDEVCYD